VHILLIVVIVVVMLPLFWLLRPRGYFARKVNRAAWRRNDEGRGNFMTRPIWGSRARRPRE